MIKKWLFKINRVIIYPLFFVTIIFLLSGYSLTYHFYAYKIIPQDLAFSIHVPFCIAFLILFLAHSLISIYFAVLRKPSKPVLSIRLARWAGRLLFVSALMMIVSGYSMTGTLKIISPFTAVQLHSIFSFLTAFFFIVHAGIYSYFLTRKWVRN